MFQQWPGHAGLRFTASGKSDHSCQRVQNNILSKLLSCSAQLASATKSLQGIQNAAARLVFNQPNRARHTPPNFTPIQPKLNLRFWCWLSGLPLEQHPPTSVYKCIFPPARSLATELATPCCSFTTRQKVTVQNVLCSSTNLTRTAETIIFQEAAEDTPLPQALNYTLKPLYLCTYKKKKLLYISFLAS